MKFKIKNKLENLVGVLLVAAVLLAVVFTGNTNKGSKVVVEKEIGLLQQVKERGYLICGVNANLPGFSAQDEDGNSIRIRYSSSSNPANTGSSTVVRSNVALPFGGFPGSRRFK